MFKPLSYLYNFWDVPFIGFYGLIKKYQRKDDINLSGFDGDIEIKLHEIRLNPVFKWVSEFRISACIERVASELSVNTKLDAYSCSQQICNAFYLYQLCGDKEKAFFKERLLGHLKKRVSYILHNYEFKTNNIWFSNHLLNNYRALVLFEAMDLEESGKSFRDTRNKISQILNSEINTIFHDNKLFLREGSTSYEILILKHCVEIDRFGDSSYNIDEYISYRIKDTLRLFKDHYFVNSDWLFPWFGDLSPDWRGDDIYRFIDCVYRDEKNLYHRVLNG